MCIRDRMQPAANSRSFSEISIVDSIAGRVHKAESLPNLEDPHSLYFVCDFYNPHKTVTLKLTKLRPVAKYFRNGDSNYARLSMTEGIETQCVNKVASEDTSPGEYLSENNKVEMCIRDR